jgi:hypothetical protein
MDWNVVWQWLLNLGGLVGAAVIAAAVSYPLWLPHLKEFIAGWGCLPKEPFRMMGCNGAKTGMWRSARGK